MKIESHRPVHLRELTWRTWRGTLVRAGKGFMNDNCSDWAAALTYYGVLAIFPAAIVIVSLSGLVVDKPEQAVTEVGKLANDLGAGSVSNQLQDLFKNIVESQSSAKVLLSVGLIAALWAASGYISAFTRASNAIYGVDEGRPFYKLRPIQLGLTAITLILMSVAAASLVLSGRVTDVLGDRLNLGDAPKTAWNVGKWPLILIIITVLLSLLFWVAPNVQQPRFRWLTIGGAVALLMVMLASVGFGIYVANFASYDETYGALGGAIAFLVWLFLANCAVMLGVEINAELQRGRTIQAGGDPDGPALPPKAPADDSSGRPDGSTSADADRVPGRDAARERVQADQDRR